MKNPRSLRVISAGWILALALTCALPGAEPPSDPLVKGLEFMQAGKLEAALQQFAEGKTLSPSDYRAYYYSGVVLLRMGRLREAAAELAEAVKLRSDAPQPRLLQAEVLLRLGMAGAAMDAVSVYEQDEVLESLDGAGLWALGELFFRLDRFDQALKAFQRLREEQPDNPQVSLRLGEVLLALSRFDEADASFEAALKSAPKLAPAHYGLGLSAWRRRDLEIARQHLEKALQGDPDNASYAYQLGVVLLDLGELDTARKRLEQAEPAANRIPEVYASLARVHRRLGNRDLAQEYAQRFEAARQQEQASKERARQVEKLLAQATRSLKSGQVAQARDLLNQVVDLEPGNGTAHSYLAKIYLSSRRWREAEGHLRQLEAARGQDFEVHYLWAEYFYQLGRASEALSRVQAALELRPADAEGQNLLGNIYVSLGRYEEALPAYEKAVDLAPDRADFKLNLETTRRRVQR